MGVKDCTNEATSSPYKKCSECTLDILHHKFLRSIKWYLNANDSGEGWHFDVCHVSLPPHYLSDVITNFLGLF